MANDDRKNSDGHLCDKCEVHLAWEEKMKTLENVPTLMTWMNQEKGGRASAKILAGTFIGLIFSVLMLYVSTVKTDFMAVKGEIQARQEVHERIIRDQRREMITAQESISNRVNDIAATVTRIDSNLAMLKVITEGEIAAGKKASEDNRKIIDGIKDSLPKEINRKY